MQNAARDNIAPASDSQNDPCGTVALQLVSLIEHVQTSLLLVERTIDCEMPFGSSDSSANVIVLDDVSPRYSKVTAALQACDANLGIALRSLLDPGDGNGNTASPSTVSIVGA